MTWILPFCRRPHMEIAATDDLYFTPRHPYTEALLSAVPQPDPDSVSNRIVLEGEVPDPSNPPAGCLFHPRCPYAVARCRTDTPELDDLGSGHFARCHRVHELQLRGIDVSSMP